MAINIMISADIQNRITSTSRTRTTDVLVASVDTTFFQGFGDESLVAVVADDIL